MKIVIIKIWKIFYAMMTVISGMSFTLIILFTGWLTFTFAPQRAEVLSLDSPTGDLIAKLTEQSTIGSSYFTYSVVIQNQGPSGSWSTQVAILEDSKRNDCAFGVELEWKSDDLLLIKYFTSSGIRQLKDQVVIEGRLVKVKLVPDVLNSSAACGAMQPDFTKTRRCIECSWLFD